MQDPTRIGEVVAGRYEIESVLGAGAMGTVYRARDSESGEHLALKILRRDLAGSEEANARFGLEALVGLRIDHPNCVGVADFGTGEDGAIFLAMELLDGESLGDVLAREGRMDWRRALRIARNVLRGLGHAHEHDIVHRDIKPDNIFLCPCDADPDLARVLDFGIAKLTSRSAPAITAAGITVGTPEFLSPEQAAGGVLDGRSDLYSLSVVLYELIAGRTPFAGDEPLKILLAHTTKPVPMFAEVAPEVQVPEAVEQLVRHGLEKHPADRIPTAAAYIARIDEILGDGTVLVTTPPAPVAAPPAPVAAPPAPRARPMLSRRTLTIVGAVGGAVLLVGIIAAIARGGASSAPASAAPPPAAAERPKPPLRDPAIDDALQLSAAGDHAAALTALKALRRSRPDDPQVPLALGHISRLASHPKDAVAAYRATLELDPSLASDPVLIADLVALLASKTAWQAAASVITDDVGAAALPALTDAAEHHANAKVRSRAATLRDKLAVSP